MTQIKAYIFLTSAILLSRTGDLCSQTRYYGSTGSISFFSTAPVEDIKAKTETFSSVIDVEKGTVTFNVPVAGFVFPKPLMRQHFNEQYMESDKFPSASFTGTFSTAPFILPQIGTDLKTRVNGKLTIKGITKDIDEEAIIEVTADGLSGFCKFNVRVADYGIKIPKMFIKNIAEVVEVTVIVRYKKDQPK